MYDFISDMKSGKFHKDNKFMFDCDIEVCVFTFIIHQFNIN